MPEQSVIPVQRIENCIYLIRGHKVMLDSDLAALYRVETKTLNRAVKRNLPRFPDDFAFQLTRAEVKNLTFQFGTSSLRAPSDSPQGWGGRRYLPYAFTEQGVAMLSSVLRSARAIQVNVTIMRTFVRLRQLLSSNAHLARKLEILEKKYNRQFRVVFEAIRKLMEPDPREPNKDPMGFQIK